MDIKVNYGSLPKPIRAMPGFCCVLCRAPLFSGGVCEGCLNDLPNNQYCCRFCGNELLEDGVCGNCIRDKPYIDKMVCGYKYAYPVDRLIKNIKYNQSLTALEPLCDGLTEKILMNGPTEVNLLIPVPMPRMRMRLRGMNQAIEITRIISKKLQIPGDYFALQRSRHTPPMHDLDVNKRRANVLGAFSITETTLPASVAIIDDIITTGATCNEISCCLKAAGVERVEAWALARAC